MFPGQEEDRERFFARLDGKMTEELLSEIEHAYVIAKAGLKHTVRDGETDSEGKPLRSFEHARRTAIILMDLIGCFEPKMICAALLHDVPEDSRHITISKIGQWFRSPVLAGLVAKVSKIPKDGYLYRLRECARHGDWEPVLLKLCDRLDNLRSLGSCDRAFQRKQGDETRQEYLPLFEAMLTILPDVYCSGATAAVEEAWRLTEKYESTDLEKISDRVGHAVKKAFGLDNPQD